MRKLRAIAAALGRVALAALGSAGGAEAGVWIPFEPQSYAAPLLGRPERRALRLA